MTDLTALIQALRTARPDSLTELREQLTEFREQLAVVAEALHETRQAVEDNAIACEHERDHAKDCDAEVAEWRRLCNALRAERDEARAALKVQEGLTHGYRSDVDQHLRERDAAREALAKVTAERDDLIQTYASDSDALRALPTAARAECTRLAQERDAVVAWLDGLSRDDDYSADYRRALADVAADLHSGAWKEGK